MTTPPPLPEVIIEEALKRFEKNFGDELDCTDEYHHYIGSQTNEELKVFLSSELSTAITQTRENLVEEIRKYREKRIADVEGAMGRGRMSPKEDIATALEYLISTLTSSDKEK